jgi:hypothetical protein
VALDMWDRLCLDSGTRTIGELMQILQERKIVHIPIIHARVSATSRSGLNPVHFRTSRRRVKASIAPGSATRRIWVGTNVWRDCTEPADGAPASGAACTPSARNWIERNSH